MQLSIVAAADAASVVCIFATVAIIAVALTFARFNKAASNLQEWASENGYRLVDVRRKYFFYGPFFFRSSESQLVYRIVVEDADGNRRSGYARVGGYFVGLFSDRVDVIWDD